MMSKKCAKNIQSIHGAIVEYISNNASYESTDAINESIKKIERAPSIEAIFRIPIDDRLYNFTTALQWLYFMCFIINVIKDEHIILPGSFNIKFSIDTAIVYISNKYNAANKTFYQDYFDDSDSE